MDAIQSVQKPHVQEPHDIVLGRASSRVVVIVMEAGSAWPSWIQGHAGGDMIVVAQTRGAPPAELTENVAQRLYMLELAGRQATLAVVAVADWGSAETSAARWAVARALLTHLRLANPGSLVFSGSEGMSAGARACFVELTASIVCEAADRRTSVGVHFNSPGQTLVTRPARSGVELFRVSTHETP